MVNNPRGKLLNQSDRSSYFTQKSAGGHYNSSLLENGDERHDFRQRKFTFFGVTRTIAKSCKRNIVRQKKIFDQSGPHWFHF